MFMLERTALKNIRDARDLGLEYGRQDGWKDCLESVRASLKGYPYDGGDVEVMQAVESIVAARLNDAYLKAIGTEQLRDCLTELCRSLDEQGSSRWHSGSTGDALDAAKKALLAYQAIG